MRDTDITEKARTIRGNSVPAVAELSPERDNSRDERITGSHPGVKTPSQKTPGIQDLHIDQGEKVVHRLNEAAQLIEDEEGLSHRILRALRLAPLRDISAEIRRESTPHPSLSKKDPESEPGEDLSKRMPDLWPWLQEGDPDESESDNWANRTDPLQARHFPDSAESARIEQEDIRRAIASGLATGSLPRMRPGSKRMRFIFVALAILAIFALAIDGVLLSAHFKLQQYTDNSVNGPPTLTLSSNIASIGETITLYIGHFTPSSQVLITHDIQEPVQIGTNSSLVKLDATGSSTVKMLIDNAWGPGFHPIVAEDVTTRYTASATLQIVRSGPTRPSHLLIDVSSIDMGTDLQGANSIQPLTLHNTGGGSITWSASSNQPWLLFSPTDGVFSTSQTIAIAVTRNNLKAADGYKGIVTFSSNVGAPIQVEVVMNVEALVPHVGAVLAVTPPVLSFTALDGQANPADQILTVSNPGSQALYWSLSTNAPSLLSSTGVSSNGYRATGNWLSTDQSSGVVVPGSTGFIRVSANSQVMLPGVYTETLLLSSTNDTVNNPQLVSISLTVQPRCGLRLSTGSLSFTAVAGQSSPSSQSISLGATSSCTDALNWHATVSTTSASWLSVTPDSGQLKGATSVVSVVGVNIAGLQQGIYNGTVSFLTDGSTQVVDVVLSVQAPPAPSAPIMAAAPLTLNFSTTQGLPNPGNQVVTITNNGGSPLNWHTTVNALASSWLGASPSGGTIKAGQTGLLMVSVNTSGLTPGSYVGQVTLIGTDSKNVNASGSPQVITINLQVQPPCTLAQPSLSSIAFTATQGSPDPSAKQIQITASGNCNWPLTWKGAITTPASWLNLSPTSGTLQNSGQAQNISIGTSIVGLTAGTYTTQISIMATDGNGIQAQASPQVISVTLTVFQPCTLQVSTPSMTFTIAQGQPSPGAKNLVLSETGNCVRPVTWTVSGDAGSTAWLMLSPTTGTDNGTGSGATVSVNVNPTGLVPNTYTGSILVTATGSGGGTVQSSPQTISVTLIITGFTVSGTVTACPDVACATPTPLAGATVTLNNGSSIVAVVQADASGNYTFKNLPLGTYTVNVAGTDSKSVHYVGSAPLTIVGNVAALNINAYPG